MKLLLTSSGFANTAISEALVEMVAKKPEEIVLVFIPTASNVESGDKQWLIEDLKNIQKQNFKSVAITDISAVPENIWRPQLEDADVLFFEGGNSYHLMRSLNESGLTALLPELLRTRVYMGVSAGSMVTGPYIDLRMLRSIYGEDTESDSIKGLGYVDFYILPHLNSLEFPLRTGNYLEQALKGISRKTYVLDDQSVIRVEDARIAVVGGGRYLEFN